MLATVKKNKKELLCKLLVTFCMCPPVTGQFELKMSAVGENPLDPATSESRKRKGSPCDTSGQRSGAALSKTIWA